MGEVKRDGFAENELISRFQENLAALRKVARMTAQDLADEIGVSRQTINSLERGKTKMSKVQYLALRSVFNFKASDNQALAQVIKALVDDPVDDFADRWNRLGLDKKPVPTAVIGATAITATLAGSLGAGALAALAPVIGTALKKANKID